LLLVAKLVTTGCSDVKDGRLSGQMCLQALSDDHKRFCRLPDLDDECEMRMRGWFVVVVKGSERGEGGSPHGKTTGHAGSPHAWTSPRTTADPSLKHQQQSMIIWLTSNIPPIGQNFQSTACENSKDHDGHQASCSTIQAIEETT
jgi:hypothetical protein